MVWESFRSRIKFNRREWAGSFGDIGTDFPLITGMILASGLDVSSVCVMFGVMQIIMGFIYGLPMPIQPLKAMAVIVITQKLSPNILYGGGLAIGIAMLILSLSGLINWITKIIPKCVIRGIQFGLGMQLATLALKDYVHSDGFMGYGLAGISFLIILFLLSNRKCPPALLVIFLGIIYAFAFKIDSGALVNSIGFNLPRFHVPTFQDILMGFLILALPQLPLSIGNSVLATKQAVTDFFPERSLSVRKISLTYSLMNLIMPFFSGIPVCHGSGGIAGHYTFGARTGGSVVLYGLLYLFLGLFFNAGFGTVIQLFPKPMLGVILMFEGLALMRLIRDIKDVKSDLMIAFMVGMMAVSLPYGYVVGLLVGTIINLFVTKQIIRPVE